MRRFAPAMPKGPAARSSTSRQARPGASTFWRTRLLAFSASRSRSTTPNRVRVTSAILGPTSAQPSVCSVIAPTSTSKKASAERSTFSAAGQRDERLPGGLALVLDRLQAGLPAAQVRLVAHHEPEHHVDARVLARECVRLRHVGRLRLPRDAEDALVGWIRLVAVLRDPQVLWPV